MALFSGAAFSANVSKQKTPNQKPVKKGNPLLFQSSPTQKAVTIHIIANVPQFVHGKLVGGFVPKRIFVYRGQQINLVIESLDVEHIFVLPAYQLKIPLIPGKKEHVSFTASKTGMFFFHCGNRECAPMALHRLMVGQFIVEKKTTSKK